jgi:hypothetical protein
MNQMSNKRQGAVEWLYEQMFLAPKTILEYRDILEQAKEKQRQQLDHAFINGKFVYMDSDETSQQYYEENYEQ